MILLGGKMGGDQSYGIVGIVGMGAVFAATSRAPITAVLGHLELIGGGGDRHRVVQEAVRRHHLKLKLRRRGIDLPRGRSASLLETLTVAAAMLPVPPAA